MADGTMLTGLLAPIASRTVRDYQRQPYNLDPLVLISNFHLHRNAPTPEFESLMANLSEPGVDALPHAGNLREVFHLLPGDVVAMRTDHLDDSQEVAVGFVHCQFTLAIASRRLKHTQTGPRCQVYCYPLLQDDESGYEWMLPTEPLPTMVYVGDLLRLQDEPSCLRIPAEQLDLLSLLGAGTLFRLSDVFYDTVVECINQPDLEEQASEPEVEEEDEAALQSRRERHVGFVARGLLRSQRARAPSNTLLAYFDGLP
jgi:hypothetical protein